MEYEWTDQNVMELIADIKGMPCLWDSKDPERKSRNKTFECYTYLGNKFGISADAVKNKFGNLLQTYRSYKRKERRYKIQGEVYKPIWFAYESINSFMEDVYTPQVPNEFTFHFEDEDTSDRQKNQEEEITFEEEEIDIKPDVISEGQVLLAEKSTEKTHTRKITGKRRTDDSRMDELYTFMKKHKQNDDKDGEKTKEKTIEDECLIFGQLIAAKLKKLDEMTREFVMNDINNIMFRAAIRGNTYYNQFSQVSTQQNDPLN